MTLHSESELTTLTSSQMQALEKCIAFIRRALEVTGSSYLTITEMHIRPDKCVGKVDMSIVIDDKSKKD